MRADRLLSILLLLQVHRRLTARDLASRLEVSERTIHRDMEALSTAGIPVTAERGASGGWALVDNYRTDLTGLTDSEIQALFLNAPSLLLADLGLRQASEAALLKLLAALPSIHRRDAEFIRQRILVDVPGWQRIEEAIPTLPDLQDAIWHDRKVQMTYQRSDGPTERLVEPLGLVAKGSVWYLVALADGEFRTYRVSRILNVTVTNEPITRPADFDLNDYWQRSSAEFRANLPRYRVDLRATEEALNRLHGWFRFVRVVEQTPPDAEGWCAMVVDFEVEEQAVVVLRGLGDEVKVLRPEVLRELLC
jgi:predicted DNA-binding transcriptional regulator YafY